MINATEMAKPFGKVPAHFLRNEQTLSFIDALRNRNSLEPVKVIYGDNGGTWMHQKLALKFAAWLSTEFELWVYDRIEELLTTGQTALDPSRLSRMQILEIAMEAEKQVLRLQEQNLLQLDELNKVAPKVQYHDEVLTAQNCHTATTIAKELGMSAKELNKILNKKHIHYFHDGHWVLYSKYQDMGLTKTRTHKHESIEGGVVVAKTSLLTVYTEKGREFIHNKLKS